MKTDHQAHEAHDAVLRFARAAARIESQRLESDARALLGFGVSPDDLFLAVHPSGDRSIEFKSNFPNAFPEHA